jgi:hypothetical protein
LTNPLAASIEKLSSPNRLPDKDKQAYPRTAFFLNPS